MLAAARSRPDTFVIGIDADAASMREASRRAARIVRRGGVPNARFIVSSVEALPSELSAIADSVTVHFPWGSLLRGLLTGDGQIVDPIVRLARPGACVTLLVSVTDTERATGLRSLSAETARDVAEALSARGMRIVECRPATDDDLGDSHSTWAKRLNAASRRSVWLLRFVRG